MCSSQHNCYGRCRLRDNLIKDFLHTFLHLHLHLHRRAFPTYLHRHHHHLVHHGSRMGHLLLRLQESFIICRVNQFMYSNNLEQCLVRFQRLSIVLL